MLFPSRRLLFGFAVSGCLAASAATAQDTPFIIQTPGEPPPAPPVTEFAPPVPGSEPAEIPFSEGIPVSQDIPSIVRISDLPPEEQIGHMEYKAPSERREFVSPHYGWTQPGRLPMRRTWVPYHKFFPNTWTGLQDAAPPVRRPVIYMPTDTTQLGYYYQHVPHWHAYPGMIPPVPRPVDWHIPYVVPKLATANRVVHPAPVLEPTPDLGPPQDVPAEPTEADLEKSARRVKLVPLNR